MQKLLLAAQRNEITEYHIYNKLAKAEKDPHNAKILRQIAKDELRHHDFWKTHTKTEVKPSKWSIFKYSLIAKTLGLTFGIRLMEKGEAQAQVNYDRIAKKIPEAKQISEDEDKHEQALIEILNERKLEYIGSMVLGINDALVELTGALAGLTFALQNTQLIALTGGITGIAASLSMAASEYLSTKTEDGDQNPFTAAFYTGLAYIMTVVALVAPYMIFEDYFTALAATLAIGILIILFFTFYISVAKNLPFRRRFLEMAGISLGVAAISFGVGYLVRVFVGVEV